MSHGFVLRERKMRTGNPGPDIPERSVRVSEKLYHERKKRRNRCVYTLFKIVTDEWNRSDFMYAMPGGYGVRWQRR